jgi:type IV secretory pathway TrbD component
VALIATAGSAVVLAMVHSTWLDAGDGVVLVISLAVLARTLIRLASDPFEPRRRPR